MYEVVVDPQKMLEVTIEEPTGIKQVVAVTCAYVPATNAGGGASVALEVVWDPANTKPDASYLCPPERLSRVLLPPARVKRIRPYSLTLLDQ
jgi:hypothetical protein